jgi:formate C-acetyltransferase
MSAPRERADNRWHIGGNPVNDVAANVTDQSQKRAWRDFSPGRWERAIDVRDFIQRNVTPYQGDESFLTAGVKLQNNSLFRELLTTRGRN